jgi:hypothetical protein
MPERAAACRIFYDGTSDDVYSNFKPFRFSIGALGFLKGEQFFHVAKAMLCEDLPSATRMMLTTGGPKLRSLGREVSNYDQHGTAWEDIDTGLVLLVCLTIKLAALRPVQHDGNEDRPLQSGKLLAELIDDGSRANLLYIAEGAKDGSRCGIGIHAEMPDIHERCGAWGRNQLGHACIVVATHVSAPESAIAAVQEPAHDAVSGDAPSSLAPPAVPVQQLILTPAGLCADERYGRRTCGMHAALLATLRAGATPLRELCERLLAKMPQASAAIIVAPPIGPPNCVAARGDAPAVVIWLLLDPLDIDSKQTTFVLRENATGTAAHMLSSLYKWNPSVEQ